MKLHISCNNAVFEDDEISPKFVAHTLSNLNGKSCSELHLIHEDKWLYITGDGERARLQYTYNRHIDYLSDGNNSDAEMFVTLSNGEADIIPFKETMSIEQAIEICHYFLQHSGNLPDKYVK